MHLMAQNSAQVGCQIRVNETADGRELEAVVSAGGPVSGTYSFDVGRGGDGQDTSRSGPFKVEASGLTVVDRETVRLGSGDSYSARLSIEWANGSSSCSTSFSS